MQLPAFAAVLDMTDPARGSDVFQLFFQTLGTIVNIEAGKQGRQPWVMSSESHRDIQVTFAKYLDRRLVLIDGLREDRLPRRKVDGHEEEPRAIGGVQRCVDGKVARSSDRADR